MKKATFLLLILTISVSLLAGCKKAEQPELAPDPAPPRAEMTEEERIAEMIKMIEAEEAHMEAAGEL